MKNTSKISDKIIGKLKSLDRDSQIHCWQLLNQYDFPSELAGLAPEWWVDKEFVESRDEVLKPVMQYIDSEFTEEETLRYHNVQKGRMTDDEFTIWFKNRFAPDDMRELYYNRREKFRKIEWWKDEVWKKIEKSGLI